MIEKPFLTRSTQLKEVTLKQIFVSHLNVTYPFLLAFERTLPQLAQATYYGDLQNELESLRNELAMQIVRIEKVFNLFHEIPLDNHVPNLGLLHQDFYSRPLVDEQEALQQDLSMIFNLQSVLSINHGHYLALSALACTFNNFQVRQYVQFCYDECEDSQKNFGLIAFDYMRNSVVKNLY